MTKGTAYCASSKHASHSQQATPAEGRSYLPLSLSAAALILATCSAAYLPKTVVQSWPGFALQRGQRSEIGAVGSSTDCTFSSFMRRAYTRQSRYGAFSDPLTDLLLACKIQPRRRLGVPDCRTAGDPFRKVYGQYASGWRSSRQRSPGY